MRKNKSIIALLVSFLVCFNLFTFTVHADSTSSIAIELDKTNAKVGDIIKATIKINNIENFSGYQVNLRYNAAVLEAINPESGEKYSEKTVPGSNDILLNGDYSPLSMVDNVPSAGILNFGRSYVNVNGYKEAGKPENSGILAIIGFKVLKEAATEVIFENLGTMPGSKEGTLLYSWDGTQIKSDYKVMQSEKINPSSEPAPLPKYTQKGKLTGDAGSQGKTNGNMFIIIILVVIILLVVLALVFLLRNEKKSNGKDGDKQWLEENDEDVGLEDNDEGEVEDEDSKMSEDKK